MEENLIGQAMVYIYLLAMAAGMGLLTVAFMAYWGWGRLKDREGRKTSKMKRRGA